MARCLDLQGRRSAPRRAAPPQLPHCALLAHCWRCRPCCQTGLDGARDKRSGRPNGGRTTVRAQWRAPILRPAPSGDPTRAKSGTQSATKMSQQSRPNERKRKEHLGNASNVAKIMSTPGGCLLTASVLYGESETSSEMATSPSPGRWAARACESPRRAARGARRHMTTRQVVASDPGNRPVQR